MNPLSLVNCEVLVGIVGLSDKSLYEPLVATVANVGLFNISDQLTGPLEPPLAKP